MVLKKSGWQDPDSMSALRIVFALLATVTAYLWLLLRPYHAVAAENLFLRKQLAMYQERGVKPGRTDRGTRLALVLRVLKTPYRSPRANSICERLIGSLRREALGWVIPLGERHLRRLLNEWADHYNSGRPHMSLGPGLPAPLSGAPMTNWSARHSPPAHSEPSRSRCSPDFITSTAYCQGQRDDDQILCGPQEGDSLDVSLIFSAP